MEKVIEVKNLVRIYKSEVGYLRKKIREVIALNGISFEIYKGELFGLVGPNGAGKTTTVKILCTLLTPSSGSVKVLGCDVVKEANKIRSRINVMFGGERGLYWRLSGRDNLRYFAYLYEIKYTEINRKVDKLLDLVGLSDRADEKVENYSRGMKQRLHLAKCLVNDPEIIFMDEPTAGLDPAFAHDLRNFIKKLRNEGKTIFLTSHNMTEVEELCDRVAIINKGNLVALDSPQSLKRQVTNYVTIEVEYQNPSSELNSNLGKMLEPNFVTLEMEKRNLILKIQLSQREDLFKVLHKLYNAIYGIKNVRIREPTLEDVYLKLIGYQKK